MFLLIPLGLLCLALPFIAIYFVIKLAVKHAIIEANEEIYRIDEQEETH